MRSALFLLFFIDPLIALEAIQTWDFRPECFPFMPVPVERYGRAQFIDFDNDGRLETITVSPH
ncbi:hypothetical protein EH223_06325, partial [candidate division KSB1 bacterium]